MNITPAGMAFVVLGFLALWGLAFRVQQRLELSSAKH